MDRRTLTKKERERERRRQASPRQYGAAGGSLELLFESGFHLCLSQGPAADTEMVPGTVTCGVYLDARRCQVLELVKSQIYRRPWRCAAQNPAVRL